MKKLIYLLLLTLIIPSLIYAEPGDTITTFDLAGEPDLIEGLAKDWDDGDIWVAGFTGSNDCWYGKFDPVTHNMTVDWSSVDSHYQIYDIGYGYEDNGTTYLLMTDPESPYTKMIDPVDGSYDGSLPDFYWAHGYTYGCAVDTDTNDVYLSSYETGELVYYDGSTWYVYDDTCDKNPGVAIGWDKIFVW